MSGDEIAVRGCVHLELESLQILEKKRVIADDRPNLLQKPFWFQNILRLERIENKPAEIHETLPLLHIHVRLN